MSIKYVHELPYHERSELCLFLDMNNQWKELGGRFLDIDFRLLDRYERLSQSPTESILLEWGSRNGTILKLFGYLYKMHNFQAMRILKPFVDPEYHRYIREEDSNPSFSSITEFSTGGNHRSSSNPCISSKRNGRRNPTPIPAASQSSSQRRSESGSGETRPTLETLLPRISLEACSLHIPYSELEQATGNWNKARILGKGGFGVVFNGSWKNTAVAIKRLESQRSNDPHYNNAEVQRQQSLRELKYLNNYKHDNILPLYGYSIDGEKPCLVYQLMSNGSLEDRLQCRRGTKSLSWWHRVYIANGSARGLQFLHSMDVPLIHGDIKSANILLDSNFVPKLGDFGLAKEGPVRDITHVEITKVQGTKPYLPPEFLRGRKLSVKVDTYGFGVVLCELATGLRAYDESRKEKFLRDHCHEAESDNCLENLKDPKATPEEDYFYTSLIKLGIHCTKITARERPLMADVLKELDSVSDSRRRPSIDRRPSLPVSHSYQLHHLFLTPNASNHQRPLSTSPSRSVLPQVPEITQEYPDTTCEPNRISPSVKSTRNLSLNPSDEPTKTDSVRNENYSDTRTDDDFHAEGNEIIGSEPPIPFVSKLEQ